MSSSSADLVPYTKAADPYAERPKTAHVQTQNDLTDLIAEQEEIRKKIKALMDKEIKQDIVTPPNRSKSPKPAPKVVNRAPWLSMSNGGSYT